jgi:hypothetical protein
VAKANGVDLGRSQLVDGYANGWLVTPKAGAPTVMTIEWTPQQAVWKALVISGGAGLLCIGIVAFAVVRRRRRGAPADADADAEPEADDAPVLRGFFDAEGKRRPGNVWTTVVVSGVLAAVLVRPWVGVLVAGFVFLAMRRARWRFALRIAPAAIIVALAFGIAFGQQLRHYPQRLEWPTFFDWARYPAWIAIVLLAAEGLLALTSREGTGEEPGG